MNNTILALIIVTLFMIGSPAEYNLGVLLVYISMVLAVLLVRKIVKEYNFSFFSRK